MDGIPEPYFDVEVVKRGFDVWNEDGSQAQFVETEEEADRIIGAGKKSRKVEVVITKTKLGCAAVTTHSVEMIDRGEAWPAIMSICEAVHLFREIGRASVSAMMHFHVSGEHCPENVRDKTLPFSNEDVVGGDGDETKTEFRLKRALLAGIRDGEAANAAAKDA